MAQEPSDTILVAIRITLRIRESKVRNPDPPDRRRFAFCEHIFFFDLILGEWTWIMCAGRKRLVGEQCDSGNDVCDDVNAQCVAGQCACSAGYTAINGVCGSTTHTHVTCYHSCLVNTLSENRFFCSVFVTESDEEPS